MRHAWRIGLVAFVMLLAAGRPALAAGMSETTRIEIKLGDVTFLMHQVCIGEDPKTHLIRVVTQMELTPGPYANTWVAKFVAQGPDEDRAHAFAALAGLAMFYNHTEELQGFLKDPAYLLDVNRLSVWPGPVNENQALGAIRGGLGLYITDGGVLRSFNELAPIFGFAGDVCQVR